MKPFLQEVAERIYRDYARLEDVTVVFPNRRAALYFRKHLTDKLTRPVFAPRVITIEDFFQQFSDLRVPDKLILIARLFKAYTSVMNETPADSDSEAISRFEDFYFWGEMLLRDFDEVDKYLIPAEQLFRDLSHQKELDASFSFLTEEQRTFLKEFWSNFDVDKSVNKRRFLRIWRQLFAVYDRFRSELFAAGLAYEGMLHRSVTDQLAPGISFGPLVFAGFNALTAAEEKTITFFVEHCNATVFWDVDEWYVNNDAREAGMFFREYQQKSILGRTFDPNMPAHFQEKLTSGKELQLYGAAQPVGQAKIMSQVLANEIKNGLNPEETLVVLADEKLLMPVLHGISGSVDKLNVTMGYPLSSTPMFNFIEQVIDLQIVCADDHFNHRQAMGLLGHAYVVAADPASAAFKRREILKNNWVHIPAGFLATDVNLHRLIFHPVDHAGKSGSIALLRYLQEIVREAGGLTGISDLDKEYAFQFLKLLNVLESVLSEMIAETDSPKDRSIRSFLRLFRQLVRMQRMPFSGEPLRGLQVMGVLETRNLDFKNVFILSLNEGAFPSMGSKGSYIPHNIRKAYGLPTMAHQDAMYSYLFYRTLQRAENIFLFYNTETDVLGQGEMSRYLQQLIYESGLRIRKHIVDNPIHPSGITPLEIKKTDEVMSALFKLNEGNSYFRGISPSALNSYIECRLQFYFKHVAKVREADEVEEELDARVLGNFLHDVMENFYRRLEKLKGTNQVEKNDFKEADKVIDGLIDDVFRRTYKLDPSRPVVYGGQRLVVREIVKRFAQKIIRMDEDYAPFRIEALEKDGLLYPLTIDREPFQVMLGGKIDRVDSKGDVLRIIDYKTGKDELNFQDIDSLFTRQKFRNKAAFQTLLYALMYVHAIPKSGEGPQRIVPGLINRVNVFDDDFEFGLTIDRKHVSDAAVMFPRFREKLKELFEELYDREQPFDQTSNLEACRLCSYRRICYR